MKNKQPPFEISNGMGFAPSSIKASLMDALMMSDEKPDTPLSPIITFMISTTRRAALYRGRPAGFLFLRGLAFASAAFCQGFAFAGGVLRRRAAILCRPFPPPAFLAGTFRAMIKIPPSKGWRGKKAERSENRAVP